MASFVAPVSASARVMLTRTSSEAAPFSRMRLSYSPRFTVSLSTSYAVTMAWNRFSASGLAASSRTLSGWHFSTSFLYTFRTSSAVTVLDTPRVA